MTATLYIANTIVTMNEKNDILSDAGILVEGNTIVAVDDATHLKASYPNAEKVFCDNALLMPGLVNTHCHLSLIHI